MTHGGCGVDSPALSLADGCAVAKDPETGADWSDSLTSGTTWLIS